MDYWYNNSSSAFNVTCSTTGAIDCGNYLTLTTPEPLIDWLPNSCLYTKYVPTWHLVRSYK